MDTYSIILLVLSLVISTVPWLLPDLEICWKIVTVLTVFVGYLSLAQVRLYRAYKKTTKRLNQTNERHTALSRQFDTKVIKEKKYRRALDTLGDMLTIAATSKKEAKFDAILKAFVVTQNDLDDEGE